MIKKRIFALLLCAAPALLLVGCSSATVEKTASRAGKDLSETVSRAESSVSSMLDPGRTVDSGTDGWIGEDPEGRSSGSRAGSGTSSGGSSGYDRRTSSGLRGASSAPESGPMPGVGESGEPS